MNHWIFLGIAAAFAVAYWVLTGWNDTQRTRTGKWVALVGVGVGVALAIIIAGTGLERAPSGVCAGAVAAAMVMALIRR